MKKSKTLYNSLHDLYRNCIVLTSDVTGVLLAVLNRDEMNTDRKNQDSEMRLFTLLDLCRGLITFVIQINKNRFEISRTLDSRKQL